jgi:hypothetical protein
MREKEIEMVNYVASGKTTKRVVQNSVFLLTLGFAALAFVATPLTAFAACPNEKPAVSATQTAKQTINRQGATAVLVGRKRTCQAAKRVLVKINGQGNTLNGLCMSKVSVVVTVNGKRMQLPIRQ